MRISVGIKILIAPLIALLLLAGCIAPSSAPVAAPAQATGTLTISLKMPKPGYRAQHLVSDIQSLVFGLVDVSDDPYFGYADGGELVTATSRYHAALAGDGTPSSGLLSGLGLTDAQQAQGNRYLYVSTGLTGSRSMTFGNIKPSATARYVAFAAAFAKNATAATVAKSDAIGFTQSAAFSVATDGSTTVPPLAMALDRGLGSLRVFLDIDQATNGVLLSTMSRLVVGVADVSPSASRTPYLGYETSEAGTRTLDGTNTDPTYHQAIAGFWVGDAFTSQGFSYLGTPLSVSADRGDSDRFLYQVDTTTLNDPSSREILFSNLKTGANYRVFAVAFQGGDTYADIKGITQTGELAITDGQETATYQQLTLTN